MRKANPSVPGGGTTPQRPQKAGMVVVEPAIKKIQDILQSKTQEGFRLAMSMLESLGAREADYKAAITEVFTQGFVPAVDCIEEDTVQQWESLLAFSKQSAFVGNSIRKAIAEALAKHATHMGSLSLNGLTMLSDDVTCPPVRYQFLS